MPQSKRKKKFAGKKKRITVAYRRSTHDKREYNTNKYTPHFLDVFYATKGRPDPQTLARIHWKGQQIGKYVYDPSPDYQKMVKAIWEQQQKLKSVAERLEKKVPFSWYIPEELEATCR